MIKLYYKSPIFIQHIMTSVYGLKLRHQRYNKIYRNFLDQYEKKKLNPENELEKLLKHLKENIEIYKNIDLNSSDNITTLKNLPITEKEDLRSELVTRSSTIGKISTVKTGGTTGKSLKVYSNEYDKASRMAYLDYIKKLHGVKPFSRRASFTGKEIIPENHRNILWRQNFSMNQILYASFKMNKNNVSYIYNHLRKNKPLSIDGFPSSIHLVAKYILNKKIKIDWDVKAIFPTAERLTENMKEDIENAFNTKVIDQYASSEGAPFIFTGLDGKYQLGNETGLFEFLKVSENIYEIVVTSYLNYATPIIRYKIGDNVQINANEEYLNSYDTQIDILTILGRNTDYLLGSENNIVTSANMSNVIKDLEDKIIQSQFIQKDKYTFEINIVANDNYNYKLDEKYIVDKLTHRLGKNNVYIFNYLMEVPKEKSGKTRFIINEMSV